MFTVPLLCSWVQSFYSLGFSSAVWCYFCLRSRDNIDYMTSASQKLSRGPGHQKILSWTCFKMSTGLYHPSFVYRSHVILTIILGFCLSGLYFIGGIFFFFHQFSLSRILQSLLFLCYVSICHVLTSLNKAQESWLLVGLKARIEVGRISLDVNSS